ncbi:MAG: S9 family peptidase [Acidobacteriota bacterium]|jgi:dipeptidyl aminopeptidase/acylaminoacyl peptidase
MLKKSSCIRAAVLLAAAVLPATGAGCAPSSFVGSDLHRLRQVGEVHLSPDGKFLAYTITSNDKPGRPYSQLFVMDMATRTPHRIGGPQDTASSIHWSPDGSRLAYFGSAGGNSGLVIVRADGSDAAVLAPVQGTNHNLPSSEERLAWSPDGKRIAFCSAVPGPETAEAGSDPVVITRYLYKPTASEGLTRFNDNRRLHIFLVDLATRQLRQMTEGNFYEHSIDWSPRGDEILFVSNHEPNPDRVFNYDIFAINVTSQIVRQLTKTKNAEYSPRWSPDGSQIVYLGTKRELTSSETTMEDTHIWLMGADGSNRHEVSGMIDNRQGAPAWSADGKSVCFTVQERGSVHLYRLRVAPGQPAPEVVIGGVGSVGSWSSSADGTIVHSLNTPGDLPQLYMLKGGAETQLTNLNSEVLSGKTRAAVESFQFPSFDGLNVEAFLTKPAILESGKKYPMIVMMHGGPHGQQGSMFTFKAQVYASHGFATLMVNYRGSTGYGQKFADAIFKDQNGGEAKDVLSGVDAAIKRYSWIDPARLGIEGGSYGGQLTNWIITQTDRFKAAIPTAGISNLISLNYMSYYHDYLPVEFGAYPERNGLLDVFWNRSALRYVAKVKTPVMFLHGENDNDVPIAEDEQFYIALQDVDVETIMVRYPREGHGLREANHIIDSIDRSIRWYDSHFGAKTAANR